MDKDENGHPIYYKWSVLMAMNQLADEMENNKCNNNSDNKIKELINDEVYVGTYELIESELSNLYTKEQVEELLQKQRELCVEKAIIIDDDGEEFNASYCTIDDYSILSAKLEI